MAALVGAAGRVYAFEPLDANADLLERSIVENAFAERLLFRRAAVGAAPGIATLTFPLETLNSGGAYLLRDGTDPLTGNQRKDVPVVALDALDMRRPVRLIKMDVEGAEPQVIRGATRLLTEDRPLILAELHPIQLQRASGTTADEFLGQLGALGYRAHTIKGPAEARDSKLPADAAPYREMLGPPLDRVPGEAIVSVVLVPSKRDA
jgi:FkbM family methyltransferase